MKQSTFNWQQNLAWDRGNPIMQEGGGGREKPGHSLSKVKTVYDWMYLDKDPDSFRKDETPDPAIQVWLEETFGEDYRQGRLKVALHPHLKRWALYERHFDPYKGADLYQCIYLCCEAPERNEDKSYVIPSDYRGNPWLEAFSVHVGEYRTFTRKDFEDIERFNKVKYGLDTATARMTEGVELEKAEKLRVRADQQADFLDYYWNQAQADANQEAGCMTNPVFVQTEVTIKENPDKYLIVDKGSYRVKTKRGTIWENIVKNDQESGEFMDEHANPRSTNQKSHVQDWVPVPTVVIPETVPANTQELEKMPDLEEKRVLVKV
jgi:hypothetical protein